MTVAKTLLDMQSAMKVRAHNTMKVMKKTLHVLQKMNSLRPNSPKATKTMRAMKAMEGCQPIYLRRYQTSAVKTIGLLQTGTLAVKENGSTVLFNAGLDPPAASSAPLQKRYPRPAYRRGF